MYKLPDPIDAVTELELSAYTPLVRQLLVNRGITSAADAAIFLNPDYTRDVHDPFLMECMDDVVQRILKAVDANERITIYGDYDADGIPACVIMHDFFTKIGYENFDVYIPHKHDEGFGLHIDAIDTLAASGTNLIITLDLGVGARDAVAHAKSKGIEVIITDNHEPGDDVPTDAFAIVNPKLFPDYPDSML